MAMDSLYNQCKWFQNIHQRTDDSSSQSSECPFMSNTIVLRCTGQS